MYALIYQLKAENKIKWFIKFYKNIFINMFFDTGLFYEDIIVRNYIEISEKFYNEIIDSIDLFFEEEKIFWYKKLENKNFQVSLIVENFRLFIEYSEDNQDKIRFIENIEFHKK